MFVSIVGWLPSFGDFWNAMEIGNLGFDIKIVLKGFVFWSHMQVPLFYVGVLAWWAPRAGIHLPIPTIVEMNQS
jgi:hypothetical protein